MSNQHHANLREKAQRNLSAVLNAVKSPDWEVPHLPGIVEALWLRSLSVGNMAGAEPAMLQVDITRDRPIADNAFQVELTTILENSFNMHQDCSRAGIPRGREPTGKADC